MDRHLRPVRRLAAAAGIVLGLAAGSYGIANAASGSSSAGSSTSGSIATTTQTTPATQAAPNPWGGQRSDETLLTGDARAKVQAAALAKVAGGTIVRIETDADGHAAYEAHMTRQDGTPVTVYVDKQFDVVSVETR